jgi:hypothetical protein
MKKKRLIILLLTLALLPLSSVSVMAKVINLNETNIGKDSENLQLFRIFASKECLTI